MLDQEERANGRGFMKRVKERWDARYLEYQSASSQKLRDNAARAKYPEYHSASWQKLRDNVARFKKDPKIKRLDTCTTKRNDPGGRICD